MECILCGDQANKILTTKLRKGENRKVYYCSECQLGFLDNDKSDCELKEYYKRSYRKEYKPGIDTQTDPEDLFNSYVDYQEERLQYLMPYIKKDMTLLEIGCSAGMFLYHVCKHVESVIGIDFDVNSAKFASDKCKCEVYTDEIINTPLNKNSLDVICAFQTIEHIKSPLDFLLQAKEYLKDDGVLYIEVPNLDDVLLSTFNLPYHKQFYFHNAHLYYFTEKSLSILVRIAGFTGTLFFSQDYNIVNHFNWVINDKPQLTCTPGLSTPKFPLRDDLKTNKKEALNMFLKNINNDYKALLSNLKITSNISFIGKKIK